MRATDLPSPGVIPKSITLRDHVARAISDMQVTAAAYPLGKHPEAAKLSAFFAAAKTAVDLLV